MILETKFDINQKVFQAQVDRVMGKKPCSVCGGKGSIEATAANGSKHWMDCPNSSYKFSGIGRCRRGKVDVGVRYEVRSITSLTVAQIRVEYGGLVERDEDRDFDNVGWLRHQSFERKEVVMCYETGVGSGTLHDVAPRVNEYGGSAIFAVRSEAEEWATDLAAKLNSELAAHDPITESRLDEAREVVAEIREPCE